MNIHTEKPKETTTQSVGGKSFTNSNGGEATFKLINNRPEAIAQKRLHEMANSSTRITQLKAYQQMANNSPQVKQLKKYQEMANGSTQVKEFGDYQGMTNSNRNKANIVQGSEKGNGSSNPIQRVRIKMRDEDPVLMAELRRAEVPDAGAQVAESIDGIGNVAQIGMTENIIFEGHGYYNNPLFGAATVVGQGGLPPARIAEAAQSVRKPRGWTGKIILLGCKTGDITSDVSKEYFKLTETPVEVIGTKANIKVGMRKNGSNFVGVDYERLPAGERPRDLAFIQSVFQETEDFATHVQALGNFIKELNSYRRRQIPTITTSLAPIVLAGGRLVTTDTSSGLEKVEGKDYMLPERTVLWTAFNNVILELRNVSFFRYPDAVNPVVGSRHEEQELKNATALLATLFGAMRPAYLDIQKYLRGLQLQEVDFDDPTSSKHNKMDRTARGCFRDTWVDRS